MPKNTINSLSPNYRDFLFDLNLISDTVINNKLKGLLSDVGEPVSDLYLSPSVKDQKYSLSQLGDLQLDVNNQQNTFVGTPEDYQRYSVNYINASNGNPVIYYTNAYKDASGVISESKRTIVNGLDVSTFNTSKNEYFDKDKQYIVDLNTEFTTKQQKKSYLDEKGNLNVGGPSTQPYDIVGSALNGGIGFNKNGIVTNSDVRSSLVGRVLSATGAINDTDLGIIAGKQLLLALSNNAAMKLQKETLGKVNTDIFSYIKGDAGFLKPNYEITVPVGKLAKVADFIGDLAGFQIPKSIIDENATIYSFDKNLDPLKINSIARANSLLENTGKGQIVSLFKQLKTNLKANSVVGGLRQGYAPGYSNDKMNSKDEIQPYTYLPESNLDDSFDILKNPFKRVTDSPDSGFGKEFYDASKYDADRDDGTNNNGFIWGDKKWNKASLQVNNDIDKANELFTEKDKKSLLYKTKKMFQSNNMTTLVSGRRIEASDGMIQNVVHGNMSKGSGVLSKTGVAGTYDDNMFCRTWSPVRKYDQVVDLQKHRGLDRNAGNYERDSKQVGLSTLEDTGFVKIAKYSDETSSDIKNYMFSIENLAYDKAIECETGPTGG